MAGKERTRRLQEAEEQRRKEEQRAQHEHGMATLAAERAEAIVDARLQAIEECLKEEEELEDVHLDLPDAQNELGVEDRIQQTRYPRLDYVWYRPHPSHACYCPHLAYVGCHLHQVLVGYHPHLGHVRCRPITWPS
jgi:hypothetical protein